MSHGTLYAFAAGCTCPACRDANRAYQRQWQRDRRIGQPRTRDATEAREHLERLVAMGLSYAAIAALAGVSNQAIAKIASGASRSCRHATAEGILGIAVDDVADGHLVPAAASLRQLRAMSRHGIPRRVVAECLGQKDLTQMVGRRVAWKTHVRLATLYGLLAREGRVPEEVGT